MSMWLWLTLWVLFVVAAPHSIVFFMTMRWHERNIVLVRRDDRERFMRRWQSPPWYVRYTARILQHPLDPPQDYRPGA